MKIQKKSLIIFLTAGIALILAVLFACILLTRTTPSMLLPVHIVGQGSVAELIVNDAKGCTVLIADADGEEIARLKPAAADETLWLPSEEAGGYTVTLQRGSSTFASDFYTVTDSLIYTEEMSYQLGSACTIRAVMDGITDPEAWIGVYERGAVPGVDDSFLWEYLSESVADSDIWYGLSMRGSVNLFLRYPGEYTAYLFPDSGYTPIASFDFETVETDGVLAARWEPDPSVNEAGESNGLICLLGRPEVDRQQGEKLWVCWGRNNEPLPDRTPIFHLSAYAKYPVSGILPANTIFPEGATQILFCRDDAGTPGAVQTAIHIQPELRSPDPGKPLLTFAAISDTHVTGRFFSQNNLRYLSAFSQLLDHPDGIDLIVNNGDFVDNGSEAEYKTLERLNSLIKTPPIFYSIGNHESDKNASDFAPLQDRFLALTDTEKVYYSFEEAGSTFVILGNEGAAGIGDPDLAHISDQQLLWLEETLTAAVKEHPGRPIFVFIHQPLFETVAATYEKSDVIQSAEVKAIISRFPEAIVLSGHTHRSLHGTVALQAEEGNPAYLHDGVVCAVWDGVQDTDESQGLILQIYEDYTLIFGRSFDQNAALSYCSWKISHERGR